MLVVCSLFSCSTIAYIYKIFFMYVNLAILLYQNLGENCSLLAFPGKIPICKNDGEQCNICPEFSPTVETAICTKPPEELIPDKHIRTST